MRFRDWQDAGAVIAAQLGRYAGAPDAIVLALPRGGVPVGAEVARRLDLPLDVFVVRKLGVPGHEELAMGAIASGSVLVVNEDVVRALGIAGAALDDAAERQRIVLERQEASYRDGRPAWPLRGRIAILVDDGLATGASMRAAIAALRERQPRRIVVAVPVAARAACAELRAEVDEVVCALEPEPFFGVGAWYRDFAQTSDDDVRRLLTDVAPRAVEAAR